MPTKMIAILDFGSQYSHLLAKRIRSLRVYSEIFPSETKAKDLKNTKGIILSGGPASVYDQDTPAYDKKIFNLRVPILGLCYGHQLLAHVLGGVVKGGKAREYGKAKLKIITRKDIFWGLKKEEIVWMSHGDSVSKLPPGFKVIGLTADCPTAAIANYRRKIYGFQFHPEVTHTPHGLKMLKNFAVKICHCSTDWNPKNFIVQAIKNIRQEVKDKKVLLLVSGGVDSTVAFVLMNKALGQERVLGLHIDNGFMRYKESQTVKESLENLSLKNFIVVDASKEFLKAVRGVSDPEKKRQIIGTVFIKVQEKVLRQLKFNPQEWLLGQGTLYPDRIESGATKHSAKIFTHHNRVQAVLDLIAAGKVIEPLADLYKDEVREVGKQLGLPEKLVWRHTFPGPGLAIQSLCSPIEKLPNLDSIEQKVADIAWGFGYRAKVLPIKTVGVQGDHRTFAYVCSLMGGKWDWDILEKASTAITNNVAELNHVVYLLKPKRLGQIKLRRVFLTKERLGPHRIADYIANQTLAKHNLVDRVYEFPVVMIPVSLNGGESIVLRPLCSENAMTSEFTKLPLPVVKEMADKIKALKGIDAVFYDVTHKPPAQVQWE